MELQQALAELKTELDVRTGAVCSIDATGRVESSHVAIITTICILSSFRINLSFDLMRRIYL